MLHIRNVKRLYKLILRLHKQLPEDLNNLGTNYAKEEFRRHKTCTADETIVFMKEWTNYALILAKQLGAKECTDHNKFGQQLPEEILNNNLRDEQILQLYELMEASQRKKLQ